jgi:hypothetical protein
MRSLRLLVALALVLSALPTFAATRTIRIFDKRQIVIAVPEGWKFNVSKHNQTGVHTVTIEERDGVKLTGSFFPDANNELATDEALEARMRDLFAPVSDETKFEFTETVDGRAGYAVMGNATKGVRSWPGAFLVYTISAEDRESESYAKAVEVIREGLREVAR